MVSKCLNLNVSSSHPNNFLTSISNSKYPKLSNSLTLLPSSKKLNKTFHAQNHALHNNVSSRYSNSIVPFSSHGFEIEPDPTLTNDDLKPTTPSQRTFSGLEMASLWVGLVVGVPSYYLAGSLVDLGMAWWQGIATVVAANIILFVPLILTGHPGTRYGISFPVLARSSFGIHGAHIPTLLRALVGCGWYGIETWIGGETIFLLLPNSIKQSTLSKSLPWLGTSPLEFFCFIAFMGVQLSIVWKGIEGIRELEKYSAPILILLVSLLLIWSYVKAGGFGHMLSLSSKLSKSEFWSLFFPSLTANISFWAALALNIPDFTRYAKSQNDQIIGQAGLPIFMGAFTFVGIVVTSSTKIIFGHVISNPIQLLGKIGGFVTTILAILGISLATITTNIAANVVAPANALVNLSPMWFNFRRGAILTAFLGIAFQPWKLLKSSESFVYTWLVGYSALMGPIGGIILVNYSTIDKQLQELNSRFSEQAMDLLTLSCALTPKDSYKAFNVDTICTLVEKYYPMDFNDQEKIHLCNQLEQFIVDTRTEPSLKNLSTIQELCSCLVATERNKIYFLIDRLLRLIMTLPVSTATTERSFSAMKIIKSRLRNKMGSGYLNDSMTVYIEREISASISSEAVIDDFKLVGSRNDLF